MIFDAEFFDTAYQILRVLDRRCRQNAVAEIKNVPAAAAETFEHPFRLLSYLFLWCEQNAWIQVSLKSLS